MTPVLAFAIGFLGLLGIAVALVGWVLITALRERDWRMVLFLSVLTVCTGLIVWAVAAAPRDSRMIQLAIEQPR